jgi:hypothetical protein
MDDVRRAAVRSRDRLARDTLIPRLVWKAGFVVVAVICLWKGFQLLAP